MLHKVIELNPHAESLMEITRIVRPPITWEEVLAHSTAPTIEDVIPSLALADEQTLDVSYHEDVLFLINMLRGPRANSLGKLSNEATLLQRRIGATKERRASAFIREALQSRIKTEHLEYRPYITQQILNNNKVIERDKIETPLMDLEKEGLIALIDRVYGGCVHTLGKYPTFQKVIKIAKHVYNETKFQNIRVGVIADKLKELMPALGINTLRKLIKKHAPLSAQKFGRHSKDDKDCVNQFIAQEFNLLAN